MKYKHYKKLVLETRQHRNYDSKNFKRGILKEIIMFFVLAIAGILIFTGLLLLFKDSIPVESLTIFRITIVSFNTAIMGRLLLPRALIIISDIKLLKYFKDDYKSYMNLYSSSINAANKKEAHEIIERYKNNYREKHDELISLIKKHLVKPADPLIVQVLAGLIFLCNDPDDFGILFNAKYKHGPAGKMIPEDWVALLSDQRNDEIKTHSECAKEFLSYWSDQ